MKYPSSLSGEAWKKTLAVILVLTTNLDADLEDLRVSSFHTDVPHLNTTSAIQLRACEAISITETLSRTFQEKN